MIQDKSAANESGVVGNPKLSLTLKSLRFYRTGSYGEQFRFPFHVEPVPDQVDNNSINWERNRTIWQTAIETVKVINNENPGPDFHKMAGRFMIPRPALGDSKVEIVNDWHTPRLVFVMEIHVQSPFSYAVDETLYVTGYTDHVGVTSDGVVDPDMKLHLNTMTQLRTIHDNQFGQLVKYTDVVEAVHILTDQKWGLYNSDHHKYRMRPEDIFTHLMMSDLAMQEEGQIIDMRIVQTHNPVKSWVGYNVPSQYLSTVTKAALAGRGQLEDTTQFHEAMMEARNMCATVSHHRDPFLTAMKHVKDDINTAVFSFKELSVLFPKVAEVMHIEPILPAKESRLTHQVGDTANWGEFDTEEHQYAIRMAQVVNAVMRNCGVEKLLLNASTATLDAPHGADLTLFSVETLPPVEDSNENRNQLFDRIRGELAHYLSNDRQTRVVYLVKADAVGETIVEVSLDGGPFVTYCYPSFADSLLVPALASSRDLIKANARSLEVLIESTLNANPVE